MKRKYDVFSKFVKNYLKFDISSYYSMYIYTIIHAILVQLLPLILAFIADEIYEDFAVFSSSSSSHDVNTPLSIRYYFHLFE